MPTWLNLFDRHKVFDDLISNFIFAHSRGANHLFKLIIALDSFSFPRKQLCNHILESINLEGLCQKLANDDKSIKKTPAVAQEIQCAISLPRNLLEIRID